MHATFQTSKLAKPHYVGQVVHILYLLYTIAESVPAEPQQLAY